MAEVADSFRSVRARLEKAVNAQIASLSAVEFEKWAVIAILRPDDHPDYQEVSRLDKRKKVIEFRLKIDYAAFSSGSEKEQFFLLKRLLLRSLGDMPKKGIPLAETEPLKTIVERITYL
jgi:hypothetical protein